MNDSMKGVGRTDFGIVVNAVPADTCIMHAHVHVHESESKSCRRDGEVVDK
jgi:hypothetical protein